VKRGTANVGDIDRPGRSAAAAALAANTKIDPTRELRIIASSLSKH
jgi:hypothetical protein